MELFRDYPVTLGGNTFLLRKVRGGFILFHNNRLIIRASKARCMRWAKQIAKVDNEVYRPRPKVQKAIQLELLKTKELQDVPQAPL